MCFLVELDASQRDIVFLLDGSDYTKNGFQTMCQFVGRVVEKLSVGQSADRVSVVQYSTHAQVHFLLNTHYSMQDILRSIESLQHQGGPLNTGAALDYVKKHVFTVSSGSRHLEGVPQILILITGGRSQDDVRPAAASLKQNNIVAFCVGTHNADVIQLQMISNTPSHTFTVPWFDELQNIEQNFMSYIKRVPHQPVRLEPTILDGGRRDIVFLIDGSDNTKGSFSSIQNFIQMLAERLSLGQNRDHISVVQYSDNVTVDFFLNTHSSREDIIDSVQRLRHKGGKYRNTGAALQYVVDEVFNVISGSRKFEGVPQILILLTAGRSRDDIRGTVKALKKMGVIPISVGTTNADTLELQTVSHEPNYFFITNFDNLFTIKEDILALIKGASVKPMATTVLPSIESVVSRDVAFLVDGSDDSRNGFEAIRGFIQKVVENLSIEENGDRVALVQYNRNATANFYLNSYSSKNEVLNSMRSVKHKGGRPLNSGAALQFIRDYIFTPSSGGRRLEGVPQILYMFCGGRSNDDIRGASQALRDGDVKIFTIGTRNADTLELQTMSSTPAFAFSIHDFNYVDSIYQNVVSVLSGAGEIQEQITTSEAQIVTAKADIVFLIDGSDDAQNHFEAIRGFVAHLVDNFDIGHDKDQIAVVQFSNTAVTSFNLNTYTSTAEVENAVQNLIQQGGRPQYIGSAIQFVKNNVLTPKNGSRGNEGVKQILVILASGRSRDSPIEPASILKNAGVTVFAIGSGLADQNEMEAISSQADFTFEVPNFHNLQSIQQSLLKKFAEVKLKEEIVHAVAVQPKELKRDIAFLVDGSDNAREGFQTLCDFLYNFIANLIIGINDDRIAVIQYSNVAVANFYLNSFSKKEDVLNAVKGLTHRGGRPLNTANALWYVKNNIFVTSSGSRRSQGVPQILIVMTAGQSRDNITEAANNLKSHGVSIIGIGIKNSNFDEVKKISSKDKHFFVKDFTYLPEIQRQLVTVLTINLLEETTEEQTSGLATDTPSQFCVDSQK
ncbi:collagen alpha-3(VI) chain-like [Brachyhypopomus gauderio]|uniref:collagen alpha-3(VI) chain-like n=1 Tax=Brachyhypopomus gauderio TaxID=698409 RepID=UPI0040419529